MLMVSAVATASDTLSSVGPGSRTFQSIGYPSKLSCLALSKQELQLYLLCRVGSYLFRGRLSSLIVSAGRVKPQWSWQWWAPTLRCSEVQQQQQLAVFLPVLWLSVSTLASPFFYYSLLLSVVGHLAATQEQKHAQYHHKYPIISSCKLGLFFWLLGRTWESTTTTPLLSLSKLDSGMFGT